MLIQILMLMLVPPIVGLLLIATEATMVIIGKEIMEIIEKGRKGGVGVR
jgi:hypothetical protein